RSERMLLERDQAFFDERRGAPRRLEYITPGEFIQGCKHSGATERIGAPSIGAFAIIERGENVRRADRRRDRHAVAQALAEDDDVGFQAVGFEREEVAGAAEVRLDFIEDEDNVISTAELLKRLQIPLGRMIRAAAAKIRLGN